MMKGIKWINIVTKGKETKRVYENDWKKNKLV